MARVVSVSFETDVRADGLIDVPRIVVQALDVRVDDVLELAILAEGRRVEFSAPFRAGLRIDPSEASVPEAGQVAQPRTPITMTAWRPDDAVPGRPAIRERWTAAEFDADIGRRKGPAIEARARELREWAEKRRLPIWWGRGREWGGWIPYYESPSGSASLFELWTTGTVEMQFQYLKNARAFADVHAREQLRLRLNQIEGVAIQPTSIDKRPSFAVPVDNERFGQLLEVLDWIVDEIQRGAGAQAD